MSYATPDFRKIWGFWAVIAGAVALLLVFVQIVGPTFEEKPSAATQIGEIAGEIKRSAWRKFLGLPREQVQDTSIAWWNYVAMLSPILGIMAIVLSLISRVRRENWRFAVYGTTLGAAAVLFQYFWWLAIFIACVVLLVSIIENIGDIFNLS